MNDLTVIQICYTVGSTFLILSVKEGNGRHIGYLQPSQVPEIIKWSTIYATVLFTGALFTKCSIALFILRLIGKPGILRKTKMVLYAIMVAMTIVTIVLVALWLAVCTPLEKVWNRAVPGTCLPSPVVHSVAYAQAAFAIATDLLLTISPICIFWSLKISPKKKLGICILMSLGLAVTVVSIMKNVAVTKISNSDFTCKSSFAQRWNGRADMWLDDSGLSETLAVLESSLGIITACIPTFVQLFKSPNVRRYWNLITSRVYGSSKGTNNSGSTKEHIRIPDNIAPAYIKTAPRDPYSVDDAEDFDTHFDAAHLKDKTGAAWERSYEMKYTEPILKEI